MSSRALVGTKAFLAGWYRSAVLLDGRVLASTSVATDIFGADAKALNVGQMLEPRSLPELVTLADGRVLAIAGYGAGRESPILASCELFEPASGTWSPAPPLSTPRLGAIAVTVGDRVIVIGGCADMDSKQPLATAEAWTLGDGAWRPIATLPGPCGRPAAARLADGTVLVVDGGAWIWDPRIDRWSESRGGPVRTRVALAALAKGGAIVVGGFDPTVRRDVTTVDVLRADGTWTMGPALDESRCESAALELADGRVVVVGGAGTRYTTPDTSMLYEWEADYRRSSTEYEDRHIVLEDARVLAAGATEWKRAWLGKFESPRLVALDAERVVVSGLTGATIWTP